MFLKLLLIIEVPKPMLQLVHQVLNTLRLIKSLLRSQLGLLGVVDQMRSQTHPVMVIRLYAKGI